MRAMAKLLTCSAVFVLVSGCGSDPAAPQSFTVGGTVSGYTGSGLTLLRSGGTPLVVAAGATSFSFADVASGTNYVVTVGTQPTNPVQACSVVNGSASVLSANITNIVVTCVTVTVGGTVTGLTGTGLAVRINGGVAMPIASGATSFAFPNVFAPGNDYRVTISGQPATPAQTCTLVRGQGRISTASISNIGISCSARSVSVLSGTYQMDVAFLTFFLDGTFSYAERSNDVQGCGPTGGNGIEYGVYGWNSGTGALSFTSVVDGNGICGVTGQPGPPPAITMVKNAASITVTTPGGGFTIPLLPSTAGSLVGAFARDDGNDGSFVVFFADGTYFVLDAQAGTGNGVLAGFERGCYTIAGASFTTSLAAACQPIGMSALDLNGTGSFSDALGLPITFVVTGGNALLLGGTRSYARILPN